MIIIDEISMVRADIIDCVDRILRVYSGNMRLPFGGKQLLFVGDVFQLEPVVPSDQKEILSLFYASPFFFSARVFKDINLVPIELQKVYRQTDPVFINVLDRIRNNAARKQELDTLNGRYFPSFEPQMRICILRWPLAGIRLILSMRRSWPNFPEKNMSPWERSRGIFRNPHYLPS